MTIATKSSLTEVEGIRTPYAVFFRGDISGFVSHEPKSNHWASNYDYLDPKLLEPALRSHGLTSPDSAQIRHGPYGAEFVIFFPDIMKHTQSVRDQRKDRESGFYSPSIIDDESRLVTTAYLVIPDKNERSGYRCVNPEQMTGRSLLEVKTKLVFKSHAFEKHTKRAFDKRGGFAAVRRVLRDLRGALIGGNDAVHVYLDLGVNNGLYGDDEYCQLRMSDYQAWRGAQVAMVPALKEVFTSAEFLEAVDARRKISLMPKVRLSEHEAGDRSQVAASINDGEALISIERERLKRSLKERFYQPAVEAVAKKFEENEVVLTALMAL